MPNQIARQSNTNKMKKAIAPFGTNFNFIMGTSLEFSEIIIIACGKNY